MTRFTTLLMGIGFSVVCLMPAAAWADHTFIGAEKCKMCHRLQYESWAVTKHANTWTALKANEKTKVECVSCHSTNGAELPSVQCEACHGAGSDYKALAIMKNRGKAIAAGLILPDEAYCTSKCHNPKSQTFKGFNFRAAVLKVHNHKVSAASK